MSLYIVPVPIGNPADITRRAVQVLESVDFLVAEDTRRSARLLTHLGIAKPVMSYFSPREKAKAGAILKRLQRESAALISDSGTPVISDPGFLLVREAISRGIPVVPLPGPTAFVPALCVSGLPADRFLFLGFPPRRRNELERNLRTLAAQPFTLVFYESPRRILDLLAALLRVFGDRPFALARELSKKHESVVRGNLATHTQDLEGEPMLGEMVLVVGGYADGQAQSGEVTVTNREEILRLLEERFNLDRTAVRDAWMRKSPS
ncbi:MAG TPA: 16S rRNA (cytidine(1402)-2'-O)-methyltransferase [Candidatus Aminicenantes bacterium]|nr:16S rRNA (cytidine(1402)-2'-O)-methyltransferase [Candidatus Aminicenantes bacterium]